MEIFTQGLQEIIQHQTLQLFLIGYLIFKTLDFLTGVSKALKSHSLKSAVIKQGFGSIANEFIAIVFSGVLGVMIQRPIEITICLVSILIFKEGLSIIENLIELGVPIPQKIKDALAIFNTEDKKENTDK